MGFDVATYTDVSSDEAIDGIDGFNFQSASSGVSGGDFSLIRERLLHRIVPSWSIDNDPLEHPPTCNYLVSEGRSYLSRGISTGVTISGRPGNQITQTILTSDPGDFVPYRPAQLYGAVEWVMAKAPRPISDRWITPLEVKPEFKVAALKALVSSDEWAAAILPHYVTMINAAITADPTKLVLIHDDLNVVMQWIALGTLFVDTDTARLVTFRALVDDPWRADAMIVGISPRFGLGDLTAANVLNLSQRLVPSIEPSESARTRASWFLEHGADDAINAIEIARRWEPSLGAELANNAARVVGLPETVPPGQFAWHAGMAAAELLAGAGLRDDLSLHADELCDATFGYGPRTAQEFALAGRAIRRTHDLDVDNLASGMLVSTLEALTAAPANLGPFARELSGSPAVVRWSSTFSQDAASSFIGELMGSVSVAALPELFAAARVIAAPVAAPNLASAVQRLADAWVEDPSLGRTTWQNWLVGHAVLTAASHVLVASLRNGDDATIMALLGGDWDFVSAHLDDHRLNGWLKAAHLARVPMEDRAEAIRLTTGIPDEAWRVALAGSRLPRHAELWGAWITHHGLHPDMATSLTVTLRGVLDSATRADGSVPAGDWRALMESLRGSTNTSLATFANEYSEARSSLKRARNEVVRRPSARLDSCHPYLARHAPFLLPDVGWLLLNSSSSDEVARLLQAASPWGPKAILTIILDRAATIYALRTMEQVLAMRSDSNTAVAVAADRALADAFAAKPKLLDMAKAQPHLRAEIEKYRRAQSPVRVSKRSLGGLFGWRQERQ